MEEANISFYNSGNQKSSYKASRENLNNSQQQHQVKSNINSYMKKIMPNEYNNVKQILPNVIKQNSNNKQALE